MPARIAEIQRYGKAASQVAEKFIPGIGTSLPRIGHQAIEKYEQIPPVVKLGLEALAIPVIIGFVAKHRARHEAIKNIDWQEVADEVKSVANEYTESAKANPNLDELFAQSLIRGNELRKQEGKGQIFDATLAALSEKKSKGMKKISDEMTADIATATIKNLAASSTETVSYLLSHIPHAEGYMDGVDQNVADYAEGVTTFGKNVLDQLNQTHGTTTQGAMRLLSRGYDAYLKAHEKGKEEAIEVVAKTTQGLITKVFGEEIVAPASHEETEKYHVAKEALLNTLAKDGVVKAEGSRRNRKYSEADLKEVEAAVQVYTIQQHLLSDSVRKTAGVAEVMVVYGATLAQRYNAAMAAKEPTP